MDRLIDLRAECAAEQGGGFFRRFRGNSAGWAVFTNYLTSYVVFAREPHPAAGSDPAAEFDEYCARVPRLIPAWRTGR